MTKPFAALLLWTLCIFSTSAQSYKQEFNSILAKGDTAAQRQLLAQWKSENKDDAELFVAYFNYYARLAKKNIITLGNDPKGELVLEIQDKDTTNKEPVAFMYDDVYYDSDLLGKAFAVIQEGIEKHPSRLDMRFGEIYMYGQTEDWGNFTSRIISTVHYSAAIDNKWTWADSKPLDDPKNFMLGNIQGYSAQLYDTGDDALLENMKLIAEAVLKHYPDNVESMSNIAIGYLIQKKYDKALDYLLAAEKIAPQDYIILGNIAQAYKLKGDKPKAIKYYELASKYGDEQAKEYAAEQLKELKK